MTCQRGTNGRAAGFPFVKKGANIMKIGNYVLPAISPKGFLLGALLALAAALAKVTLLKDLGEES